MKATEEPEEGDERGARDGLDEALRGYVRELLGHGSMAMTLRYAHLAPDQKREAVARLVGQ